VIKSLEHAAMAIRKRVNIIYVDASYLESKASEESPTEYHKAWTKICTAHGILVPGGSGVRGIEGKRGPITIADPIMIEYV
jgi:CTP synthase